MEMEKIKYYPAKLRYVDGKVNIQTIELGDTIMAYHQGPIVQYNYQLNQFSLYQEKSMQNNQVFFAKYSAPAMILERQLYRNFSQLISSSPISFDNSNVVQRFYCCPQLMLFGLPRSGKTTALMTIKDFFCVKYNEGRKDEQLMEQLKKHFLNSQLLKKTKFKMQLIQRMHKSLAVPIVFSQRQTYTYESFWEIILWGLKKQYGEQLIESSGLLNQKPLNSLNIYTSLKKFAEYMHYKIEDIIIFMDEVNIPLSTDKINFAHQRFKNPTLEKMPSILQKQSYLSNYKIISQFLQKGTKDYQLHCFVVSTQSFFSMQLSELNNFQYIHTYNSLDLLMPTKSNVVLKLKKIFPQLHYEFFIYLATSCNGPIIDREEYVLLEKLNKISNGIWQQLVPVNDILNISPALNFVQAVRSYRNQRTNSLYLSHIERLLINPTISVTIEKSKTFFKQYVKRWPAELDYWDFNNELMKIGLLKTQSQQNVYLKFSPIDQMNLLLFGHMLLQESAGLYNSFQHFFTKLDSQDLINILLSCLKECLNLKQNQMLGHPAILIYLYCFFNRYRHNYRIPQIFGIGGQLSFKRILSVQVQQNAQFALAKSLSNKQDLMPLFFDSFQQAKIQNNIDATAKIYSQRFKETISYEMFKSSALDGHFYTIYSVGISLIEKRLIFIKLEVKKIGQEFIFGKIQFEQRQ